MMTVDEAEAKFARGEITRQRLHQIRKLHAGICALCTRPLATRNYCEEHRRTDAKRRRRRHVATRGEGVRRCPRCGVKGHYSKNCSAPRPGELLFCSLGPGRAPFGYILPAEGVTVKDVLRIAFHLMTLCCDFDPVACDELMRAVQCFSQAKAASPHPVGPFTPRQVEQVGSGSIQELLDGKTPAHHGSDPQLLQQGPP
jgi:hypothetical protein